MVLLCSLYALAADKRPVTVKVMETQHSSNVAGVYSGASASQVGQTATGSGYAIPLTVSSVDIAVVIEGHPATLHCDTAHHWSCFDLRRGEYDALVKGKTIWVTAWNWDHSQKKALKYSIR